MCVRTCMRLCVVVCVFHMFLFCLAVRACVHVHGFITMRVILYSCWTGRQIQPQTTNHTRTQRHTHIQTQSHTWTNKTLHFVHSKNRHINQWITHYENSRKYPSVDTHMYFIYHLMDTCVFIIWTNRNVYTTINLHTISFIESRYINFQKN